MKILKRWLGAAREGRSARIKHEKEDLERREEEATGKIKKFEKAMFSLPCPFVDGNCTNKCVHFEPGHINQYPWNDYINIVTTHSKCLLWNK